MSVLTRDGDGKGACFLARTDSPVEVVDLSRNFGKEIAMTAGLDRSKGDAIIVIDSDTGSARAYF